MELAGKTISEMNRKESAAIGNTVKKIGLFRGYKRIFLFFGATHVVCRGMKRD